MSNASSDLFTCLKSTLAMFSNNTLTTLNRRRQKNYNVSSGGRLYEPIFIRVHFIIILDHSSQINKNITTGKHFYNRTNLII